MKVIHEYTLDHIRKNRRTSLSISIAVLISATLLCSLCILIHTIWSWQIESTLAKGGDWHGELYEVTRGDQLNLVEGNPHVKRTMVKGKWEALQLPEGARLPYLLLRDTDANYWTHMSEKNSITEGRAPQKTGEIAISQSFFDQNPRFRIGDTFTLAAGNRMQGEKMVDVQSILLDREQFTVSGDRTFTIVGSIDMTSSSAHPGYYAMGFLDRSDIAPADGLTVYLQMKEMRKTYEVMPQIAASLGWEKDEFGNYPLRYNSSLLGCHGIMPPNQQFSLEKAGIPIMFGLLAAIAVGTFVLITHSAFALSANARVKQLGMFRSVGATPKQIRFSILFEGLLLSALPITIGVGVGYLFSNYIAKVCSNRLGELLYQPIRVNFSWWVVLGTVALSLLTVLLSASIPVRRMAKLTPIEAIRQTEGGARLKKVKQHRLLSRVFGFSGELAADSFGAHKRGFAACISALVMCLVLVGGLICVIDISNLVNALNEKEEHYDMNVVLNWTGEADEALLSQMRNLPQVQKSVSTSSTGSALWVTAAAEAAEFTDVGGLAGIDPKKYSIMEKDGRYRISVNLVGLDDNAFADYCAAIGQNPADFVGGEVPRAIAVSTVSKFVNTRDQKLADIKIPFLNLTEGEMLTLGESWSDKVKSSYTFPVETTVVTEQLPVIDRAYNNYSVQLFMPMESYYSIVENFLPERAAANYRTDVELLVGDGNSIAVQQKLETLCKRTMAEGDYIVTSKLSDLDERDVVNGAVQAVFNSVAVLLGLIGVFNSFTSVAGNMRLRRREFAMLRSVGLDSAGIGKILLLEGIYFALLPVLVSIPFLFAICALFLWMMNIGWAQFLPAAPWGQLLICFLAIMAAVGSSYWLSARKIKKDTIIEAIKDETI